MVQFTLNNIEQSKINALLYFLKSWDMDVEVKQFTATSLPGKKHRAFSLTAGLWSDYAIDAADLRKRAWSRS